MITIDLIRIPIRKYYIPIFMSGILSLLLGIKLFQQLINILNSFSAINFLTLILTIFIFFLLLNSFCWFLFGYEEIQFHVNEIKYSKSHFIKISTNNYTYNHLNSVYKLPFKYMDDKFINNRRQFLYEQKKAIFFWYKMGRLELVFKNGDKKSILNGVTENQLKDIVSIFNEHMNK